MFGEMAAQRIDQLGSLAHEQVSGAEEHGTCLLLLGLHGDKPHGRPRCRFGDCRRIGGIVLLALHGRLHIGGRDQPHVMAQLADLADPAVGAGTSLHRNNAARLRCKEVQNARPRQFEAECN